VKYSVVFKESEEGFAVSVPELPGCHSQGKNEAEALENIQDAIQGYLEVAAELDHELARVFVREVEVAQVS
jgi:predicted RNase H-like HicB family nuclease